MCFFVHVRVYSVPGSLPAYCVQCTCNIKLCPTAAFFLIVMISFSHMFASRFPLKNPQRLEKWVCNMKRADKKDKNKMWTPTSSSALCSEHFNPECFDKTGQTTRLKKDAVPTLFDLPEHLKKVRYIAYCVNWHRIHLLYSYCELVYLFIFVLILFC